MFKKQIDFMAIGDITTDAFIRLKEAETHCNVNKEDCELCMPFGDKIPFEYVKVVKAVGNAANAAVAAARLGLYSGLISNIGDDQNGKDCLAELQHNKVVTSSVQVHSGKPTNYHFVLWYEADRTILVNHIEYDYRLPVGRLAGSPPKWIYLTSLAANSHAYHGAIADYLEANPSVKLAFQPGTFQMESGYERLKRIYARTEVFIVNKEEAERILKTAIIISPTFSPSSADDSPREPRRTPPVKFLGGVSAAVSEKVGGIKQLLKNLAALGPKIAIITDSTAGAYMFDGDHYYHMPSYPDPRPAFDRTGCGDAFASTFVAALAMGKTPLEALLWAPVNPMSVAQFVGSREGLLSREQIEWWLSRAPENYRPREI
ncbi:carbohydrate kinase family protein [Patescibacteria group bacterium]|nr:carbohydrate kinase family protein [Patescibacteria group bacterium]MDE1946383.1 carbohydrate kinase family protein [Patescibacteria group bacterium]MDE2010835.1 carbohydrate kinase family protein [Patescibacteria group bacterium]MDE2233105.1 carbohydrate kinase family protein [Patescibacteria group bacterium]